jgi:type VI secretion system secreted protein VgrG
LSLDPDSDSPHRYHGLLAAVEGVAELAAGAAVYVVTLSPRLSHLALTVHSRVFVDETLPSIVEAVLKLEGVAAVDYELRLIGTYPVHPHVCQYHESSLSFLSRAMEREGVYWYFEHGDAAEKLVITDDRSFHPRGDDAVKFALAQGSAAAVASGLVRFNAKHASVPGRIELRGYDYLRPTLPVTGAATIPGGVGVLHLHDEHFTTPEEGSRLARLRAEQLVAKKKTFHGFGTVHGLRAGQSFKLEEHPRLDGEYLVTALNHFANQLGGDASLRDALSGEEIGDHGYHVEVTAIPQATQYRPERSTAVPRIYGTERAMVDGEAQSHYAQLDEHGRYLVRMHFDENEPQPGKGSTRIRMMQSNGGGTEAMHFPLRKGTEVVITFEGGDPDRPVIAGVVPNVLQPSPVTAKNATKNILQSGGGNKLVMEDEQGKQYIHLRTSHKGTYLHLGAPFNPSYTKASSTDGTSMSYTRDISTSVTGSDAQTLVEDSRITVIGRSRIHRKDPQGTEIGRLVGAAFLEHTNESPIFSEIQADTKQAASDAAALAVAVGKLNSQLSKEKAIPPAAMSSDGRTAAAAVQSASKALLADLQTLWNDAAQLLKEPKPGDLASPWHDAVQAAFTPFVDANTTATMNSSPQTTDDASAILGAFATGPFPSTSISLNTLFTDLLPNALGTDDNLVWIKSDPRIPAVPFGIPSLPHPSTQPTYIAIGHPNDQFSTMGGVDDDGNPVAPVTIDKWIESQATSATPPPQIAKHDPTAIDRAPKDAHGNPVGPNPPDKPLNQGSDIKVVGGDNVTIVAFDTRSQVQGHTYSLVQGGATAVLYSPQATTDAQAGVLAPIVRPTFDFAPTSHDKTWAQFSTTYGNTLSWVDGTTSSRVLQGAHSVVYSPDHRPLALLPDVRPSPPPIPSPEGDSSVAQSSEIYGNQQVWVQGDKTTTVTGDQTTTINGHQQTNAGTQTTNVMNSLKFATFSEDLTWAFKFGLCTGMTLNVNVVAASITGLKIDLHAIHLKNTGLKLQDVISDIRVHGIYIQTAGLTTFT